MYNIVFDGYDVGGGEGLGGRVAFVGIYVAAIYIYVIIDF